MTDDLKVCAGCGRSYPANTDHFPKAGRDKSGGAILRNRCRPCYVAYTAERKSKHGNHRPKDYDGGGHHRPEFVLPAGCAFGQRGQLPICPEGEGLPVLLGPGGRPVLRVRGGGVEAGGSVYSAGIEGITCNG